MDLEILERIREVISKPKQRKKMQRTKEQQEELNERLKKMREIAATNRKNKSLEIKKIVSVPKGEIIEDEVAEKVAEKVVEKVVEKPIEVIQKNLINGLDPSIDYYIGRREFIKK